MSFFAYLLAFNHRRSALPSGDDLIGGLAYPKRPLSLQRRATFCNSVGGLASPKHHLALQGSATGYDLVGGLASPTPPTWGMRMAMTCLFSGIFSLCIMTLPLHAATLNLSDVYQALRNTLPMTTRMDLTAQQGHAAVQLGDAPYQLQVAAEAQGDIDQDRKTGLSTALTATLPLVPDTEHQATLDTLKTEAEIQRLDEITQQLTHYKKAITLYFDALTAQDAAAHTDNLIDIVSQQQAWLKEQIAIGKRKPSALTSMQLSLHRLQLQKAEYLHQKQQAMLRLSSLTGIDPAMDLEHPRATVPKPISEASLYQRPDLRKQQGVLRRLELELATLEWSFWPQVSAFGTVKQDVTHSGMLGLLANWKLMDGHARDSTKSILTAKRNLAALDLQEVFRAALGEAWAQEESIKALEAECRLAKTAVLTAESQYHQYQAEYEQNLITLLEVLQTLNSWHETQLDLSRRQIALQEAIALQPITLLGEMPK